MSTQRVNRFECDKNKARINLKKHKLRFTEGCRVFEGHTLTAPGNKGPTGSEVRFFTMGSLPGGLTLVIVWTQRGGNVRVISVRKASKKEREQFHAHIAKTLN